ncbi:MAG: SCP2 sterol-binding domain-containing protein [Ardenticatenaceae bacterium]|nr:SCP2 sterol-binding domain-containing protein [Anaerolineales bacterium]MCB8937687.1 SCP2 sterol-binding domain-containing protein [Ardenticatenaceae bacterium]MCB8974256.1 SCP2 sterol-binding domain-containing protein [Ardenticatenaceae bacterium]
MAYQNETQLYGYLQELFGRVEADMPQATDSLLKAKLCIRFNVSDPEAGLVINAKERPLHIEYGRSNNHKPDLDVDITGEALHQILLGQLSLTKAVGSKKVKPKGPVWKVMALADLFYHAQKIYPAVYGAKQ